MEKRSTAILKRYIQQQPLSYSDLAVLLNCNWLSLSEPLGELRELGYIDVEPNAKLLLGDEFPDMYTPFVITQDGRSFLYDLNVKSKNRRWENTRYWITTGVAVIALILSIIALFAK